MTGYVIRVGCSRPATVIRAYVRKDGTKVRGFQTRAYTTKQHVARDTRTTEHCPDCRFHWPQYKTCRTCKGKGTVPRKEQISEK